MWQGAEFVTSRAQVHRKDLTIRFNVEKDDINYDPIVIKVTINNNTPWNWSKKQKKDFRFKSNRKHQFLFWA